MANQRLTDKAVLDGNLATDDKLMIVDKSDTTGSAAGTSKQIDNKFIIQTDKVNVASGIFQAMDNSGGAGTFAQLIAGPASGFFNQVLGIMAVVDYASGIQGAKITLFFGYDATDTTHFWSQSAGFMQAKTADINYSYSAYNAPSAAGGAAGINSRGFFVYSAGNYTSTFSVDFFITYQVVKI